MSELRANWVALNTIVYREVRRFTRIWPQTLLPGITLPTIVSQYDVMLRYFTVGVRAKF